MVARAEGLLPVEYFHVVFTMPAEIAPCAYERGSILITSNLPFDEWNETFGSGRLTGALPDRLTHHVSILEMNGESDCLIQSRACMAS